MHCKIIPEKCIACGLCQIYAPAVFDYDENGIVLLKKTPASLQENIQPDDRQNVLKAYRKCPVYAIEIDKID